MGSDAIMFPTQRYFGEKGFEDLLLVENVEFCDVYFLPIDPLPFLGLLPTFFPQLGYGSGKELL